MGGDHKCPVCEATFTRPQHVSRHMRSHTGDRPYKCQYCGDQFARSDLLSRHVNKCHANEKPAPSTGVRRKGSASASRATTSKQVCDQCVQANTSCDGCNPCAKCIQRKFRCTFVKFHRQTAPVGPGHNVRSVESSSDSPSPNSIHATQAQSYHRQQQPDDEFILAPPPNVGPTMADALYAATPFTFPPLYPPNDMNVDNADYVPKYPPHAELFESRPGMSTTAAPPSSGPQANIYHSRLPQSWAPWGQHDPTDAYHHHQQQHHANLISDSAHPPLSSSVNDKNMQLEMARHHHHQRQPQSSNANPNHYVNLSIPYPVSLNYHLSDLNNNDMGTEATDIIDFTGSDSASHSSCSVPSSAASSSVHLPLDDISARRRESLLAYDNSGNLLIPDRTATSSTSSSSSSHHHHPDHHAFQSSQVPFSTHDQNPFSSNQHHQQQHQPHSHSHGHNLQQQIVSDLARPEFSSAFGLLSLDDPNVMAGIATDGTPFFDHPSQAHNQPRTQLGNNVANMDTPMPMRRGSAPLQLISLEEKFPMSSSVAAGSVLESDTPSKEKDSRELKEFWKQYMRTPLTGGGSEGVTPSGNGSKALNPFGHGYRRPRVASLPAVKTPIVEKDREYLNLGFLDATQNGLHPSTMTSSFTTTSSNVGGDAHGPTEMDMGVGTDDGEDLRSYEAAVRARKAPTTLNLRLVRGRGGRGGSSGKARHDERSASASPHGISSSSSSLANAFGDGKHLGSHSRDQTIVSAPAGGVFKSSAPFGKIPFAGGGGGGGKSRIDPVKKEESSSPSLLSSPASSFSTDWEGDLAESTTFEDGHLGDDVDSSTLIGNHNKEVTTRPSYKRLPSETLGPDHSKRPFYGFGVDAEDGGGGDHDTVEDRTMGGWGAIIDDDVDKSVVMKDGCGWGLNSAADTNNRRSSRRRRRMSEPSTTSLISGGDKSS